MRESWEQTVGKLAFGNIPLYLFSSGYGDVAAQVMAQNDPQLVTNTMRIISNSFRTTPDGSVRGFAMPIVHERNKNATTAARSMELPLSHRPNVIVLGSDEQDITMSSGMKFVAIRSEGRKCITLCVRHHRERTAIRGIS